MVLIQISRDVIRLTLQKNVHVVLGKTVSCRDCDPRQGQWKEQHRTAKEKWMYMLLNKVESKGFVNYCL